MKLATYRNATRDGQLMVVSRKLDRAVAVPQIAASLQAALDDWSRCEPALQEVYAALNRGPLSGAVPFDQSACHSRYRVPISGQMAVPISIMWNWCARRVVPKYRPVSTGTR
jgi:hypothetical protein